MNTGTNFRGLTFLFVTYLEICRVCSEKAKTSGLSLTVEPAIITSSYNQSVRLRCLLPKSPQSAESVYVIWRFRNHAQPPPPTTWAFMHQKDDIARCPDPPKGCELVNEYSEDPVQSHRFHFNLADPGESELELIASRQLFTLKIDNVNAQFDGTFQCYVLLNLDAFENRASLTVLSPPSSPLGLYAIEEKFTSLPAGIQSTSVLHEGSKSNAKIVTEMVVGRSYDLVCLISNANPRPNVTWTIRRMDGSIHKLSTEDVVVTRWKPFSTYLDIQRTANLEPSDDNGALTCEAVNAAGSASSASASLTVLFPPMIEQFPEEGIRILEGTSTEFSCNVVAKPSAKVLWVDLHGHVVSNTSVIKFSQVRRNSLNVYTCVAENSVGRREQKLSLDVVFPPVVSVPPHVVANKGERLEVTCHADANPPPYLIYWTFSEQKPTENDGQQDRGPHWADGTALMIPQVERKHSGFYSCYANSEKDLNSILSTGVDEETRTWWRARSKTSSTVQLSVNYAPGKTITMAHPSRFASEGSKITLKCLPNKKDPGHPQPGLFWFRLSMVDVNVNLERTPDMRQLLSYPIVGNGTTMTIHRAGLYDSGLYGCYARNILGISEPSYLSVAVEGKPLLLSGLPTSSTFEVQWETKRTTTSSDGSESETMVHTPTMNELSFRPERKDWPSILLSCTFLSNPHPTVKWLYQKQQGLSETDSWIEIAEKSSGSDEQHPGFRVSTKGFHLADTDVWRIETQLMIDQLPPDYLIQTLDKEISRTPIYQCEPEEMIDLRQFSFASLVYLTARLYQLDKINNVYACEASNTVGLTRGVTNVIAKYRPAILPPTDTTFIPHGNPRHEKEQQSPEWIGPLVCQFSAKPPVSGVKWWEGKRNKWVLVYESHNMTEPVLVQESSSFFVVSGTNALKPSYLAGLNISGDRSSSIFSAWNSPDMFYTVLWMRKEPSRNVLNDYKCQVANSMGNTSHVIHIEGASIPRKTEEIYTTDISWTSVTLTWQPGYHGMSLVDPPEQNYLITTLRNAKSDDVHTLLQNFTYTHDRASRCAQQFLLQITDFGYFRPAELAERKNLPFGWNVIQRANMTHGFGTKANKQPHDFFITQNDLPRAKNYAFVRIGHSNLANVTGLFPAHLYSVTVRGENDYGQGVQSDPTFFLTEQVVLPVAEGAVLDSARKVLRIPPGNPALCAQIEKSSDDGKSWTPLIPTTKSHLDRSIVVNSIHSVVMHSGQTSNTKVCSPLSWNQWTEFPIMRSFWYRVKYCNLGQPTECTESFYPAQNIPSLVLIVVGCFCLLAISVLLVLFSHFAWRRVRSRTKAVTPPPPTACRPPNSHSSAQSSSPPLIVRHPSEHIYPETVLGNPVENMKLLTDPILSDGSTKLLGTMNRTIPTVIQTNRYPVHGGVNVPMCYSQHLNGDGPYFVHDHVPDW